MYALTEEPNIFLYIIRSRPPSLSSAEEQHSAAHCGCQPDDIEGYGPRSEPSSVGVQTHEEEHQWQEPEELREHIEQETQGSALARAQRLRSKQIEGGKQHRYQVDAGEQQLPFGKFIHDVFGYELTG